MPAGEPMLEAYLAIMADTGQLDKELDALPAKVRAKMEKAFQGGVPIQASAATANLVAEMGKAGGATQQASNAAGYGAMKWLILAQTLDDAQYGFKSVVNNIPMLMMAFTGLNSKMTAVVSNFAVATNQFIKNWDSVKELFGDNPGLKKFANDVDGIIEKLTYMASLGFAAFSVKGLQDAGRGATQQADHAKQVAAAKAMVKDILPEGSAELGAGVREAIEAAGGGGEVQKLLYNRAIKARGGDFKGDTPEKTEAMREQLRGNIAMGIAEALKGSTQGYADLLKAAGNTTFASMLELRTPKAKQEIKDAAEANKKAEDAAEEHNRRIEQNKELERDKASFQLQNQRDVLEEKMRQAGQSPGASIKTGAQFLEDSQLAQFDKKSDLQKQLEKLDKQIAEQQKTNKILEFQQREKALTVLD
jgi:hypothetical protein